MNLASCTKLLASLAVLHLASSRKYSLDDTELVSKHIPELASLPVVQPPGEDGSLGEVPQTSAITLRQLLTHTSGLAYEQMHPLLMAWDQANNKMPARGDSVVDRYDHPLVFQPGSSWMYGPSLDYAGLFVERVSGVTLEEYMKTNLWEPLGIKDMTFHMSTRPDMRARQANMTYRNDGGVLSHKSDSPQWEGFKTLEGVETKGFFGGDGLFSTPEEYVKVLRAVLDTSIIPPELLDDFFTRQLNETQADSLNGVLQIDIANNAMCGTNKSVRKNWGLAGMLLDEDDHAGGRVKDTLVWAGLPGLAWFVDRKTDLCGLFSTQLMPTGDGKVAAMARVFEDGVYALHSSAGSGGHRL